MALDFGGVRDAEGVVADVETWRPGVRFASANPGVVGTGGWPAGAGWWRCSRCCRCRSGVTSRRGPAVVLCALAIRSASGSKAGGEHRQPGLVEDCCSSITALAHLDDQGVEVALPGVGRPKLRDLGPGSASPRGRCPPHRARQLAWACAPEACQTRQEVARCRAGSP